ncbi:hypothetical protein AMECASPLE_035653 [Ameca splendens]|uniref:Uncharacterized protein n=1 Tax=Ameca splendens TaxID=208324 RepID=A0ABV1ADT4_9TELE
MAFERDRSGEAQHADVFCWQKDINSSNWIQECHKITQSYAQDKYEWSTVCVPGDFIHEWGKLRYKNCLTVSPSPRRHKRCSRETPCKDAVSQPGRKRAETAADRTSRPATAPELTFCSQSECTFNPRG